jgi:hypothetical protein
LGKSSGTWALNPAKVFSGGGDRILEREKLDLDCAECGMQAAQFSCHKFWAMGFRFDRQAR